MESLNAGGKCRRIPRRLVVENFELVIQAILVDLELKRFSIANHSTWLSDVNDTVQYSFHKLSNHFSKIDKFIVICHSDH